ncbi:hypothetical protein ACIQU6_33960 [Streptomyces sp. NPDC090442]|uniref:hypothetical protein n=1 Tax=Streptomyces sp. NPDC090442 TaxID=3365962 RepID=UPI0037FFD986
MGNTPVYGLTIDELCRRSDDAFKAAGFDVGCTRPATYGGGGAESQLLSLPLVTPSQLAQLCRILEEARP